MLSKTHTVSAGPPLYEESLSLSGYEVANVRQATPCPPTPCPLTYGPPFMPPLKRGLEPEDRSRLMAWLDELLPGEPVDMVEWVGTDLRQPLHAVVIRFRLNNRPPIVLVRKVEEIERCHFVRALNGLHHR